MKRIFICILLFLMFLLFAFSNYSKQDEFPVLRGPYLGQRSPGMKPEVFAPGIISTKRSEGCSGFSEDGKLFIFNRYGTGISIMEQKDGVWTPPYKAPFSVKSRDGDFILSPDGKKIYIASGRPLTKGAQPTRNHNIWIVERLPGGWSKPRAMAHPINTDWHESYPSITDSGTLYFFKRIRDPEGIADIYRSRLINKRYIKIEKLGGKINTEFNDLDGFIARDESYLIFCSDRPGGYGGFDFYISFRKNDNSWTEPVNMGGKINSPAQEWIPYVTSDGKYFFFTSNKSGNRDIYWMDARIIEDLKPKDLK